MKNIGNAQGQNVINIANLIDEYSVFIVSVTLGSYTNYKVTILIPTCEITDNELYYQTGAEKTAVNITCSRNIIRLKDVVVNNTNYTNTSEIRVYGLCKP